MMTYPYPVYRDDTHLYTICRDGPGYGITMIPIRDGLSGVGHIIVTPGTRQLPGALKYLRDMARQARMQKVKKCPASVAALDRGGVPNQAQYSTIEPDMQGDHHAAV